MGRLRGRFRQSRHAALGDYVVKPPAAPSTNLLSSTSTRARMDDCTKNTGCRMLVIAVGGRWCASTHEEEPREQDAEKRKQLGAHHNHKP